MRSRTVSLALAVVACGASSTPATSSNPCASNILLVAASDYSSSEVGAVPRSGRAALASGVDLGKDPAFSSESPTIFLARHEDLLIPIDAVCGTPTGRISVHDAATTGTANPHDVAVDPTENALWVVLYGAPKIAIVKNGAIAESIDLSSFDADGNPQAESIAMRPVGGVAKAFVALERLDDGDGLKSTRTSQMLRIDVATRKVEQAIDLAGRNPFGSVTGVGTFLYLAEPGNFEDAGEPLAGIERFDTATGQTAILVAEKDLGGSVTEIAIENDGCAAAIVADPTPSVNRTSVFAFDPSTGRVIGAVLGPTDGYDLEGLAFRDATLYVGDRRAGPDGYPLHAFADAGGCALAPAAPPTTIVLPQAPVALRVTARLL